MRFSVLTAVGVLSLVSMAMADDVRADIKKDTNIPAESLGSALQTLAGERRFQIVYVSEQVDHLRTQGAEGQLTPTQALNRLLLGTGLTYQVLDENTVTVVPTGAAASRKATGAFPGDGQDQDQSKEGKTSSSNGFRVAQMDQERTASSSTVDNQEFATEQTASLQEIVVTAQKREERIQDVPMSLTALSGDQLVRSQEFRFEDYVSRVPGLTLIDYGAWGSQLVIRGITSGSNPINSPVATYIDETPYVVQGTFAGSFAGAPNLDTFDMQRIEVLRGPQGTLYGADALAGLLKYVTNPPDPSGFASQAEIGTSTVYNGGVGFDAHAMVNIPLTLDTALRLVGYDTYYPGFIDDPSRGLTDINGSHFTGGRASLLYAPISDFSVRFNALYQLRSYDDWSNEDVRPVTLQPVYGDFVQERLIGQAGYTRNQLYNATVKWNVGFAEFLSTTSYSTFDAYAPQDQSPVLGAIVTQLFGAPYGVADLDSRPSHAIVQELRLSSAGSGPFQWLVGGFFTNEGSNTVGRLLPIDATTKTILYGGVVDLGYINEPTRYREFAGFANLDYHITRTIDASLGGRYSENYQTYHDSSDGLFLGTHDFGTTASEDVFTYSADLRWHLTSGDMLYARAATGFAPGGPNDVVPTITFLPNSYKPSTDTSYEAGIKSSLFDGKLSVDVSAFYINWRDIQLAVTIGGLGEIANGGGARSKGAEWDLSYAPIRGLTLDFNGAYTDAELTQNLPAGLGGYEGERLPGAPLWSTSLRAQYEWPLFDNYTGFAGMDWRFSGNRYADFEPAGPRQLMPSYDIVDLRTGLETQVWTLAFYVKNVGNRVAINYLLNKSLADGAGMQSAVVETPRTVGVVVSAKF